MGHALAKTIIVSAVTEMISKEHRVSLKEATKLFYSSSVSSLLSNDETGLYGDSPVYVFSLFEKEFNKENEK